MSSENRNNEKSILLPVFLSVIAGFAAGAIIGMLYAPKAGKEMRRDIKEKSEELIEKSKKDYEIISDKTKEFVDKSKGKVSDLRDKSSEFIEKGKEKISHTKDLLSEKISKGKEKAKEVSDYLEK